MTGSEDDALARVYAARSAQDLGAAYADWSATYDAQTLGDGYCLPFLVAAWVARYVPPGSGPLLDAGCGTGLSGPALVALGYPDVEGLDFSTDMLALAQARGGYRRLVRATLGQPLPYPDGAFAAFLSTGVFTQGHAPASAFDELVRITRPGGFAIFTVRDSILETDGFRAAFDRHVQAGRWTQLEESTPFRAFAIAEPTVLVRAFVYRIA